MQLTVLRYPSLDPVAAPMHLPKGEIYDATFSETSVSTPSAKKHYPISQCRTCSLSSPLQLAYWSTVFLRIWPKARRAQESRRTNSRKGENLRSIYDDGITTHPRLVRRSEPKGSGFKVGSADSVCKFNCELSLAPSGFVFSILCLSR